MKDEEMTIAMADAVADEVTKNGGKTTKNLVNGYGLTITERKDEFTDDGAPLYDVEFLCDGKPCATPITVKSKVMDPEAVWEIEKALNQLSMTPAAEAAIIGAQAAIEKRTAELNALHAQMAAAGTFFETNLPDTLNYLSGQELKDKYAAAVAAIRARTAKLNEALRLSGMQADHFHRIARYVFNSNTDRFDAMTADELSACCKLLDDGIPEKVLREEWPNATVLFDTAFTTTKEWESLRHVGIGGSESSVVANVSHYTTPRMLYHDKIGTPKAQPAERDNEFVLDRGHQVEPRVIETFCKLTGAVQIPESRMFVSKKHPHSTANIDAIIRMPNGEMDTFEAKSAVEESRKNWMGNKIPRHYVTQTRQYPGVLDDNRIKGTYISCMFVVDYSVAGTFINATFDGDRAITHFVERSPEAEESLLRMEDEFWADYIVPGIEPEVTDSEKDISLHDEIVGSTPTSAFIVLSNRVQLDLEQYMELDEQRRECDKKSKVLKERQEAYKLRIIEALGPEIEGRLRISDNEYFEVRYAAPAKKPDCNLEMLNFCYPEAYAKCVTPAGEGAKRFSVKQKKGDINSLKPAKKR